MIWLATMAAMVMSVAGQELPAPALTSDTVYYAEESGKFFEYRVKGYDDESSSTVKTYVGTTDYELARHAQNQNELETAALAAAVKLVDKRTLVLSVADDRTVNGATLAATENLNGKAVAKAGAVLYGPVWDSPDGDIEFTLDGEDLEWAISGLGSGTCKMYGGKVLAATIDGTERTLYFISANKWSTFDGAYTIER